jgi:hypothetical protein
VLVRPWEFSVLEFLFGEGNVVQTGEFETVDQEYPVAAKELSRLVSAYGTDPKSGIPHANSVFGNARAGEKVLAKLIDEARAEDETAVAPAKKAAKPRGKVADSLLS